MERIDLGHVIPSRDTPVAADLKPREMARLKHSVGGMKRRLKSSQRGSLTLGDLITAVSSSARSSREMAAALDDLFERRRVVLRGAKRVQIVM